MRATATVIIPAHDEETTIGRTLEPLTRQARDEAERLRIQIIVVANGCHDRTVDIARGFPGVAVLSLPVPSKTAALRAADAIAESGLRIYLDADVVLAVGALVPLIDALTTQRAVVAAPDPTFVTDGASWPVRAFFEVFRQLPYVRTSLGSAGVYGLSPAGRRRFGDFPDLVADDLFVQALFAPHERVVTAGTTLVRTPKRLPDLLRMRTRVARGNAELAKHAHDQAHAAGATHGASHVAPHQRTVAALAHLARSPRAWPSVAVYVGVVSVARIRARRARGPNIAWERDTSTRG